MTTEPRPIREMYERYLEGRISFEELKRRTDERTDEYLRERGHPDVEPTPSEQDRSG